MKFSPGSGFPPETPTVKESAASRRDASEEDETIAPSPDDRPGLSPRFTETSEFVARGSFMACGNRQTSRRR